VTGSRVPPTRRGQGAPPRTGDRGDGWAAVSYLLGGMIFYGGIGWLLGHWVFHSALFFPLGMVVGLALSTVLLIFRFGRS
jgi:ATP synthase protein I